MNKGASTDGFDCVGNNCNAAGTNDRTRAIRDGHVADVTLAAGAAALVTGVVLLLVSAHASHAPSSVYMQLAVGQNEWSVSCGGSAMETNYAWSKRGGALHPLAWSTLVLVAGCSALLDLQPASNSGPCSSDSDCPTSEFCIERACHASCYTDYACPAGTMCTSVNSHLACLGPDDASVREAGAPEVEASGPQVEAGNPTEASGAMGDAAEESVATGDAACGPCSSSQECVEGACRAILWCLPASTSTEEPQPAPIADRAYVPVGVNQLYAQHLRVTYSGLLVRLGMLLSTGPQTASFSLWLYTDNGGYPLHLIGNPPTPQGSVMPADGSGRQEMVIFRPPHLDVGNYWIAFVSQDAEFVFQSPGGMIDTATAPVPDAGDPWLDPFPCIIESACSRSSATLIMMGAVVAIDPSLIKNIHI